MTDRISSIQLQFQRRNARKRGPTSSDQINDATEELATDLSTINGQWNSLLVPLVAALPNGVPDLDVDAFVNGIDGDNIYVEQNASASVNASYYNTPNARPNTIFEQFQSIYSALEVLQNDLENQINSNLVTASQVSILDSGGLYASESVEGALAEVMTQVDSLASAAVPGGSNGEIQFNGAATFSGSSSLTWNTVTSVFAVSGRVGIGTTSPNTGAVLDLTSTTGALLVPRMTTTQKNALSAVNGMIVYNTTTNKFEGYQGGGWINLEDGGAGA